MFEIALITLLIVAVVGIFVPKKYVPKQHKRTHFRDWHPNEEDGLPWFGNGERRKKKDKYFWDD